MEVSQNSFAQKRPDQLVYLELGSGNGGMLLSISEEGFRFRSVTPLRPNGLVPFAFSLDGRHRLNGIGEVVWLEDDAKSGGMRFADISEEFRAMLSRWLALESHPASAGREVTPAVAAPLDTMEKIREELRRGYPDDSRPARPRPQESNFETEIVTGKAEAPPPLPPAPEPPIAERPAESASSRPTFPARKAVPVEQRPKPFSRPPFSQPSDSPAPARPAPAKSAPANSAFLKIPAEAPPVPVSPASHAPARTVPVAPEIASQAPVAPKIPQVHVAPEPPKQVAVRRAVPAAPARPYIPPPEESFETAWERAKLSAPPDAPHLSRAAAGSIIGLALVVILGALGFNFRPEIGAYMVDLGEKISGENHSAAPAPTAAPDSGTDAATEPHPSEPQPAAEKKREPVTHNATAPSGTGDNRSASSAASHEKPANESATSKQPNTPPNATPNSVPNTMPGTESTVRKTAPNSLSAAGTNTNATSPADSQATPSTQAALPAGAAESQPAQAADTTGQEEFNAAREILRGDFRQRDLSRAVELLWAGVRKGYVPAEVTLADLYRRGDGVVKNCDQAQVLLVAASKKGSSDARHMLEQMAEKGCE